MTLYRCDSCPEGFTSYGAALTHTRANKGHECALARETALTRYAQIVFSFPSLLNAAERGYLDLSGEDHTLAEQLAAFTKSAAVTGGSMQAAKFCLAVWGGSSDLDGWDLKPFDMMTAVSSLDEAHRRALIAWCENPYFP